MGEGDVKGRELVFRVNHHAEQVVLAAEIVSPAFRKDFASRHLPEVFLNQTHRVVHAAIREANNRNLACDPATLNRLSAGEVDVGYLADLLQARPDVPDDRTLAFHVDQVLWDKQRHAALTGPVSNLLEALQGGEEPERIRSIAHSLGEVFSGWSDRQYLLDPEELIRSQVKDLKQRQAGRAVYPYGLVGLDYYDPIPELVDDKPRSWKKYDATVPKRMIPGTAPGKVTVITGTPGSGKSTVGARVALGLARQARKVLFGAWEMTGGTTLELIAIQSLGWSRGRFTEGKFTDEELAGLEVRMRELSKFIRFMANPFRRRTGQKASNERNLDLVHGYLADSGCEIFIADLWKRCLARADPDEEEEALFRQQAMLEELGVHGILMQQQRLKDIELRPDKRPTREGIKGSGAWVEIADSMIGVHRPALWKAISDDKLELDILKQRYGKWPLAIEFDWNPDKGSIAGGRSVDYDVPGGEASSAFDKSVTGAGAAHFKGKRR